MDDHTLLTTDAKVIWHPFTPIPHLGPRALLTRASGAYVYDDKGKPYFDTTSSWWCNLHGHCHPRLVEALRKQATTLDQVLFSPHSHPVAVQLASRLVDKLGEPFEKIFYSDDGSTAVEVALKVAMQYWQRKGQSRTKFLSLERAYHGDTLGAVAVSHVDEFHGAGHGTTGFRATVPYCYRCPLEKTYPECGVACAESAERILERDHREIAALVIEPLVLGVGGMIIYPAEYVSRLVAACRRYGVLVIFDEVFTGFGRTGTMFAKEQISGAPDIICLSKGLTSGMLPLAVTAVTGEIFDAFTGGAANAFYHGHTFTANALGCAVALESLALFDENDTIARNRELSAFMIAESARFRELPFVGNVRQQGMIWALELVNSRETKRAPDPANGPGWKVAAALWEKGVWIRPLHNVLYVVPPYCSTAEDLSHLFSTLYEELSS